MSKFVNITQSPEERRAKYALCRLPGDDTDLSRRRRDIRWNKIARHHGYANFKGMVESLGLDLEEIVVNYVYKIAYTGGNPDEDLED